MFFVKVTFYFSDLTFSVVTFLLLLNDLQYFLNTSFGMYVYHAVYWKVLL